MTSEGREVSGGPRVIVDAQGLADASRYRGIGTYLRNLLPELIKQGVQVKTLAPRDADVPGGVPVTRTWRPVHGRLAERQHRLLLPADLEVARRRGGYDVVHAPALTSPAWCRLPVVQTVHDVPASDEDKVAKRLQRCAQIVCVSEATASDVVRLGIARERVWIAPLGVAPAFRPAPARLRRHLLFVGEYDARKRHRLAVDAHNGLVAAGYRVPLIFVGRVAPWFAEEWRSITEASKHPELLEVRGYVSDAALVDLYQGAVALLVTSASEGFGLPSAEAMSCGTPVVATPGGATAEVIGDGGLLMESDDADALTAALVGLVRSSRLQAYLHDRALARAQAFSWSTCAQTHVDAYRAARLWR